MTDSPSKKGWLVKEGANWKTWRKRWFVLEKGEVKYYKSANTKKELGSFLLENATYIKPTNARKKTNCFEIPTPDRIYFLCAANAQEMQEWIECCRTAKEIAQSNNNQNQMSEISDDIPSDKIGEKRVGIEDFQLLKVIGKGSFGKVLMAKKIDNDKIYAMKVLDKNAIKEKDDIQHTKSERNILRQLDCPFLVKLYYTFQTSDKLYFIMDFINGGELFYHLQQERIFDEKRVQFYCAEILLGMEYLHNKGIIYRDLKPENILIRRDGHICMTDFGISKEGLTASNDRTATFCGTPEYLAPEVLEGKKYGKGVDYWSFGTLMYEMLTGLPPFYSQDLQVMYQKILGAKLIIPDTMNKDAADLLCLLLDRNPENRLKDPKDMKNHAYFANIDWDKLYKLQVTPPFKPKVSDEKSTEMIDPSFTEENPVSDSDNESEEKVMDVGKTSNEFEGFTYVSQNNHLN